MELLNLTDAEFAKLAMENMGRPVAAGRRPDPSAFASENEECSDEDIDISAVAVVGSRSSKRSAFSGNVARASLEIK